jgi:hypothetical protein
MSLPMLEHAVALMVIGGGFMGLNYKINHRIAVLRDEINAVRIANMTLEQQSTNHTEIARLHEMSLNEIVADLKRNKVQIH